MVSNPSVVCIIARTCYVLTVLFCTVVHVQQSTRAMNITTAHIVKDMGMLDTPVEYWVWIQCAKMDSICERGGRRSQSLFANV